jgi:hypothetical protein
MVSSAAFGQFGEVGYLLRTVGALLILGLVMGFSPTTFGIEIGELEHAKKHANEVRLRVMVIVVGVALAATILAALFLVVSPDTLHSLWTGKVRTIVEQRWLDAAVGVLLVTAGIIHWRRAAQPRKKRRSFKNLDRPRVLLALVLGESLISTTGPATMYLVVRTIGTSRPELWPIGYAVFLIGLAAPYAFLAFAITRMPGPARRLLQVQAALQRRDLRRPIASILIAAGVALMAWAVVEILRTG